jgi:hypothetical protein
MSGKNERNGGVLDPELHPQLNPPELQKLGKQLYRNKQYEEALKVFTQVCHFSSYFLGSGIKKRLPVLIIIIIGDFMQWRQHSA